MTTNTDDARDAARYRWLRSQFKLSVEKREREELESDTGKRRTYNIVADYWYYFELQDSWRFGLTTNSETPPTLDSLIDAAMQESKR